MPLRVSANVDADELLKNAQAQQATEEEDLEFDDEELADVDADANPVEPTTEEVEAEAEFSPAQQKRLQEVIDRTLAVERRRQEREYKKMFGTSDLKQIAEVFVAGQAIAKASGKSPRDLVTYVQERTGGAVVNQPSELSELKAQLAEIQAALSNRTTEESRGSDEKTARAEFGTLFDEYRADIEDKADELSIGLLDAAAMVLRPHLKKLSEKKVQARRQNVRERRVASTSESGTASGGDLESMLSQRQKIIAKKMGLSFKEYAQQLQESGLLERQ